MAKREERAARPCEHCRAEFVPRRDNARFCCEKCRNSAFCKQRNALAKEKRP